MEGHCHLAVGGIEAEWSRDHKGKVDVGVVVYALVGDSAIWVHHGTKGVKIGFDTIHGIPIIHVAINCWFRSYKLTYQLVRGGTCRM
jgi:hypothetical protein